MSTDKKTPKRRRRIAALLALLLAALFALLGRMCGLGLGMGGGWSGLLGEKAPAMDASAPGDTARSTDSATGPRACKLYLSSEGITLNDKPSTVAEAVRLCSQVGRATLRATGGAEAGTYDELVRALDAASIPVQIERDRTRVEP